MAVGDIIANISSPGPGQALNYQPAAGVEVMLTCIDNEGLATIGKAAGGTPVIGTGTNASSLNSCVCKIGITNTTYLQLPAVGGKYRGFTGVQLK